MYMSFDLVPTLLFVFVTTFTPGPNNIMATSMGALYGYRRTLPFLIGIATGFFGVMLLCSGFAKLLGTALPSVLPILRYLGAGYILWLAYGVYRSAGKLGTERDTKPLRFHNGVLLQLLNAKVILYGITIFATFLAPLLVSPFGFVPASALLALASLMSTSTWALGGNLIRGYLNTPNRAKALGVVMSLALIYTAADLLGLFE